MLLRVLAGALGWLVVALPAATYAFTHTSAAMVLAGHDVVLTPAFGGDAVLRMGPYLPDVRVHGSGPIGVRIDVGKTTADSLQQVVTRYAVIGSHPQAEVRRVRAQVHTLLLDALLRGAVVGLLPVGLWLLLGPQRRRDLRHARPATSGVALLSVALLVVLLLEPWKPDADRVQPSSWIPLQQAIPEIDVPSELDRVEVQGGVITQGTRRLVQSAFDTYRKSEQFYRGVAEQAPAVAHLLRRPRDGETLGVLVSDRHDNIGMDQVVAAIAREAGATVVIDAGDDTSTGGSWEAFSLDSLDDAFRGYRARIAITGNHDHGPFVGSYLARLGWTRLDGSPVTPFGSVRVLGVDDPRSSGLGSWVDETGLTYSEVESRLRETLCRLDEEGKRVATVVVHSAGMGASALEAGCTDLVVGGHLHVQVGPDRVLGSGDRVGYSYTNGTTGGAAYAFALGSKLRRTAEFTLITWRDGRPVGLQPVEVRTTGAIEVKPFVRFSLGSR